MPPDPVSWLMVDRGWRVVDVEGTEIGRVESVIGDEERDIFSGLEVALGVLERRFVPADRVRQILEGSVQTALTPAEVEQLERRR